jgi:hypothetical protein
VAIVPLSVNGFAVSSLHLHTGCQWLTPVILATQEAEIRRSQLEASPGKIVHETLSRKKPITKRAGGVAQV